MAFFLLLTYFSPVAVISTGGVCIYWYTNVGITQVVTDLDVCGCCVWVTLAVGSFLHGGAYVFQGSLLSNDGPGVKAIPGVQKLEAVKYEDEEV